MKKHSFFFIVVLLLLAGCSKEIYDLEIDDSNSFLDVITWKVSVPGGLDLYTYKSGLGMDRLTIENWRWNTGVEDLKKTSKTIDAKMGDIETGNGFMAFKINGIKYIYRP